MPPKGWRKSPPVVEGSDAADEIETVEELERTPAPLAPEEAITEPKPDFAVLTLTDKDMEPIRANIHKHAKAAKQIQAAGLEAERRAHPEWDPDEPPPTTAPQVNAYDLSGAITKLAEQKARANGFNRIANLRKINGMWTFEARP